MQQFPAAAYRKTLARAMSEEALQQHVLNAMRELRWRTAHFRPAKTEKGWRTAVAGDGKGFPDIIAVKGHRLVVAELKSEIGTLEPDQDAWLAFFRNTAAEVYVWRPSHWLDDTIQSVLLGVKQA